MSTSSSKPEHIRVYDRVPSIERKGARTRRVWSSHTRNPANGAPAPAADPIPWILVIIPSWLCA